MADPAAVAASPLSGTVRPREEAEEDRSNAELAKRQKRAPSPAGTSAAPFDTAAAAAVADEQREQQQEQQQLGSSAQMHVRNFYRTRPPDFLALAAQYDYFRPFVTERRSSSSPGSRFGTLDWQDPLALVTLTRVLLERDFLVRGFAMPAGHLVPPVPQRLNYLHWMAAEVLTEPAQDPGLTTAKRARNDVRGIDVGTGASCIFPLLGAASYGWNFLATEIDPASLTSARANIEQNDLGGKIELRHVANRTCILKGVLREGDTEEERDGPFDFLVCNPPFFASLDSTGLNPHRAAEATPGELACPGGEEAFIAQLIRESKALGPRMLRWCSSMLGRKSSLKPLLSLLHSRDIGARVVLQTEFLQGAQTRWGLAWTFDNGERKKRERALVMHSSSSAVAVAPSSSPSSVPAAAAAAFASAAPLVLKSRARLDVRRSGLTTLAPVRERVMSLVASFESQRNLSCTLQPPSPAGFEWTILMQPQPAVEVAEAAESAFACAVRVLQAPPSDWLVELEWKKPSSGSSAERGAAQRAFTEFVEHCRQQWASVFRAA